MLAVVNKISCCKFNTKHSKLKTFKEMCLLYESLMPKGVDWGIKLSKELVSYPTFPKSFPKCALSQIFHTPLLIFPLKKEEADFLAAWLKESNKAVFLLKGRGLFSRHTHIHRGIFLKIQIKK